MQADSEIYSNIPAERTYKVGLTGTGAAHPTKRFGPNITDTRTAAGVFKFVFTSHPGVLVGFRYGLGADTPADVKGDTVTRGTYTAPCGSIPR